VDELLWWHATSIDCRASGTELDVKALLLLSGEQAIGVESLATLGTGQVLPPMTNNV